jgi:hypothetical protein
VRPFEGAPFERAAKPGLEAIVRKEHRSRIAFEDREGRKTSSFSVDIDAAMREGYPDLPRWDYGIRHGSERPKVAFVEAHKAESGEVDSVLRKQQWLKDLLAGNRLPPKDWYWLVSGRNMIPRQSSEMRRLVRAGILLKARRIALA